MIAALPPRPTRFGYAHGTGGGYVWDDTGTGVILSWPAVHDSNVQRLAPVRTQRAPPTRNELNMPRQRMLERTSQRQVRRAPRAAVVQAQPMVWSASLRAFRDRAEGAATRWLRQAPITRAGAAPLSGPPVCTTPGASVARLPVPIRFLPDRFWNGLFRRRFVFRKSPTSSVLDSRADPLSVVMLGRAVAAVGPRRSPPT